MSSPTVSVVTPVYNGQEFLASCIESVLRQTYRDFEYLIFDNCSTDETASICARYAAMDSRIRVVRASEFLGVYGNHNRALRAVDPRARFCKIVHADDWMARECLERMIAVAERNPAVGLVASFRLVDKRLEGDWVLAPSQEVVPGRELLRTVLLGPPEVRCITGSPTTLLLRSDLFRETPAFYDETFWSADTEAAYRCLLRSDFGFVHQVLTFTRSHPGRLTALSQRVDAYIAQEGRLLIRYGPTVLSAAEYRSAVRRWLARYLKLLAVGRVRRSRARDGLFHDFHGREIACMRRDASGDGHTRRILWLCQRLVRARSEGQGCALDASTAPPAPTM